MTRHVMHHIDGNPRNNSPANIRIMNHLPGPTSTLAVMESILTANMANITQAETDITDLETALRESCNDWSSQSAILKLTAARDRQRKEIAEAARNLRTIEALRRRAGMDGHVLGRVIAEFMEKPKR